MEIFIILLLIIILILIINFKSKVDKIDNRLYSIEYNLKKTVKYNSQTSESTKTEVKSKPYIEPEKVIIKEDKEEVLIVSKPYEKPIDKPEKSLVSDFKKTTKVTKESKPSFMERNPDLEKFIGENLLSKIGIVIFVIGMGFLVKLGIDNEVITEVMRVVIGVLIGGAMIGLAHYLRSSFSQFSSILIGGALSVLYLTIGIAFHQYELISQTLAFVIMVLITSFGVLLSIYYDRKVLAILALLGGFGTPFFVSTGSGNYVNLLSYIIILDIGMLALVYFKKWNIINYLTYTLD